MIWEDLPLIRKGEKTTYVSASNIPVPGQDVFISTVWDVTQRKEAETARERLRSLELEKKIIEIKEKILSMTSHDLKSPLTIIKRAMLLLKEKKNLSQEVKKNIDISLRQASRGLKFINDFFNFQKLKDGVLKLEYSEFDIFKVINDVKENHIALLNQGDLRFNVSKSEPVLMIADYNKIEQVLSNLIENAIKHTPKGGKIDIKAELEKKVFKISIRDNGEGVPANRISNLFEYYEQARESDGITGTGMGLPIAKYIVELHGGKIWLESTPGKATTFFFTIPVKLRSTGEPKMLIEKEPTNRPKIKLGKKSVLIVDDAPEDRLVTRLLLEKNKFKVYESELWKDALKTIRSKSIDAVILDVSMPEMSGIELLDIIRREKSIEELPVIFYSSKTIDGKICKKHGANFAIKKDDKTDKLLAKLKSLFTS